MIDARWARWVGWGMAGLLALLAAGGAATRPDGWVLGAPALGAGAGALCGIALLA